MAFNTSLQSKSLDLAFPFIYNIKTSSKSKDRRVTCVYRVPESAAGVFLSCVATNCPSCSIPPWLQSEICLSPYSNTAV